MKKWALAFVSSAAVTATLAKPASAVDTLQSVVDMVVENHRTVFQGNGKQLPGVAVAIAKRGELKYATGYGVENINDVPLRAVTASTVFQIASISKQFTAVTVMRLQETGALYGLNIINDPVSRYLSGSNWFDDVTVSFNPSIKVQHLLQMASGLTETFPYSPAYQNERNTMSRMAKPALQFTPGQIFRYTNSNYFALAQLVKSLMGQPYSTVLTNGVLAPLGLTNTMTSWPPPAPQRYATGHGLVSNVRTALATYTPRESLQGIGDLSSNVLDLAKFDAALLNFTAVSATSFFTMVAPPGPVPIDPQIVNPPNSPSTYGFAMIHQSYGNQIAVYHDGWFPQAGYSGVNLMFPASGLIVVLLTNQTWYQPKIIVDDLVWAICGSSTPAIAALCQ